MERFFKDPHTLHCKRQGPFGLYIDEFAQQLSEQSYSRQYACRKLQLVAELSHWLQQRKSSVSDLTVAKMENFLSRTFAVAIVFWHFCDDFRS
jgi:hypothetical protein